MPGFCTGCGGQMPDNANNCPSCGKATGSASAAPAAASSGGGLTDNVAGMLAYFTLIPAILFLLIEPYNKNKFVRFHAFQMIFFAGGMIAIWIGLTIFSFIPMLGLLMLPVHFLVWIGSFIVWIMLVAKAYQGQMWKLPFIGDMAEKQANAI